MRLPVRFVVSLIAAAAATFASASLQGQAPATAQASRVNPAAIARAQGAVDKAAAERNMVMTDAAKRELAVEVVRQEAATPPSIVPGAAAIEKAPDARVNELLTRITQATPGAAVDADQVKSAVADEKSGQVRAVLAADVAKQAADRNLTLPDDVRMMLVADLEKQTSGLAASGIPVDAIKAKNAMFFKAIADGLQGNQITGTTYAQIQQQLFQRFVSVRIESVPPGAHVKMNDVELGVTDIEGQPLEPGKPYTFGFTLAGYQPATRQYFVAAGEPTALLTEPLVPLQPPSQNAVPAPPAPITTTPPAPPTSSFPLVPVVIGLVIIGALVFLAARR